MIASNTAHKLEVSLQKRKGTYSQGNYNALVSAETSNNAAAFTTLLELACWCDLRVADESAVFGVFCRRWGVPLADGGTVRLPRLIGHSRAMDMILTGRAVNAEEALEIGLVNRLVTETDALSAAVALGEEIAQFPEMCMRADRRSAIAQWSLDIDEALIQEGAGGYEVATTEAVTGAARFSGLSN